ncbi:GNAT family N-acetyltransferase [Bacillus salacetis]|uniref:GNAT family N-acetyltransferase n=1 Tax=Bacillus salacetis TaxID=2315464 RepID=UPI003B8373AF
MEAYTASEGRIFYIGLSPSFRGQGLAAAVHQYAAASLRLELNADIYIGVTDKDNLPMKRVFVKNGCRKVQTLEIYSSNK